MQNMRKKIVAGNWKMNTTRPDGIELAKAVAARAAEVPEGVGLIIAHGRGRFGLWSFRRRQEC